MLLQHWQGSMELKISILLYGITLNECTKIFELVTFFSHSKKAIFWNEYYHLKSIFYSANIEAESSGTAENLETSFWSWNKILAKFSSIEINFKNSFFSNFKSCNPSKVRETQVIDVELNHVNIRNFKMDPLYQYQFRLILIGDSTVGKSSLLKYFTEGSMIRLIESN